jgi:hypothetical protein
MYVITYFTDLFYTSLDGLYRERSKIVQISTNGRIARKGRIKRLIKIATSE